MHGVTLEKRLKNRNDDQSNEVKRESYPLKLHQKKGNRLQSAELLQLQICKIKQHVK